MTKLVTAPTCIASDVTAASDSSEPNSVLMFALLALHWGRTTFRKRELRALLYDSPAIVQECLGAG